MPPVSTSLKSIIRKSSPLYLPDVNRLVGARGGADRWLAKITSRLFRILLVVSAQTPRQGLAARLTKWSRLAERRGLVGPSKVANPKSPL